MMRTFCVVVVIVIFGLGCEGFIFGENEAG